MDLVSYNSGSNRARNFKSASRRFWLNYSRDYSLNCTPLGPITITYYCYLLLLLLMIIIIVIVIIIIIINSISAYQRQNYPFNNKLSLKLLCYISKLVRALWLVNLAGRSLLHGPLKFKVLFCCQTVAWFITKFSQLMKQTTV